MTVLCLIEKNEYKLEIESGLTEQLYQMEKKLLDPEVRRSVSELANLLADDFVEFGSSGRVFTKQQVVEGLPHSPSVQMTILNFQAKPLAADIMLTTYNLIKQNDTRVEMGYSLRSSIWKFIDGRCQTLLYGDEI